MEAGAAPFNNIVGRDPGLADPEHGDFRALTAPGYGCRVIVPPGNAPVAPAGDRFPLFVARPGRLQVGGVIDQDTVWDAADIDMVADVVVTAGASLTIAAGATVRVDGYHQVLVEDGDLQAIGTPDLPILLTSADPEAWRPDLDPTGAWHGLALVNVPAACDTSRLRWCVIEYAKALPGDPWHLPDAVGGALVDGLGGALRVVGRSPLSVSHCVLRNNLAERGGAIALHHGARPLLVNNLLHDNHATHRAGAVFVSYADAVLVHNTLTGNEVRAGSAAIETGCVDHVYARPWYVGNIIWGNLTTYSDDLQIREPKAINVRFCDIEGWLGGEGCLTADPLLEQFTPVAGSPVVDAASASSASPWWPAVDLAGAPRLAGAAADMGAYEVPDLTPAPMPTAAGIDLHCWPNPANPALVIRYDLLHADTVRLRIHDPAGRVVRTLVASRQAAGAHHARWDGRDDAGRAVASGVYLAHLATSSLSGSRRVTLVR